MFSRHPRIRNLNFSEFVELTRKRVKNDVCICPRGVKKEVYGIYIYMCHKEVKTTKHWDSGN